jgi:menaquinone-dependent protoporphyrinogen oxidase
VSVCLGVLQNDPAVDRALDAIAERFFARTQWRPTERKVVAGALMYTKYGWWKRRIMRNIAAKAHGDTDTSRDFEYTDWADLAAFTRQFVQKITSLPPVRLAS